MKPFKERLAAHVARMSDDKLIKYIESARRNNHPQISDLEEAVRVEQVNRGLPLVPKP